MVVVEVDVLAAEGHGGAVDGGERRSQLVRHGGDELALQAFDAPLLGEVAQRVDRAVGELHRGDGDPELPVAQVERERLRVLGRIGGSTGDRYERLDGRPAGEHVLRSPAQRVGGREPGHRGHGGVPEADHAGAVDEEHPVADVCEDAGGALAFLTHLLLEPHALQDVAGLVRDQLGDRNRDAVEPARGADGVEGQRPHRVPFVADRDDERAAGSEGAGELHLQTPFGGHLVDHERLALDEQRLVEGVADPDHEGAPELVGDPTGGLGPQEPMLRVVEEEHGRVGADRGRRRLEDVAADLLDRPRLGAEARDRAEDLELLDPLRARGAVAQALATSAGGEGDPHGSRERRSDDGKDDERRRVDLPAIRDRHPEDEELLHRRRDEQQAGRKRQRRPGEPALAPPRPEQEQAEAEQRDPQPQEEPSVFHACPSGRV